MTGIELIAAERQRQMDQEGWTAEHDDEHDQGEIAKAAECYLDAGITAELRPDAAKFHFKPIGKWPWARSWWKPSNDPIENLVKAGALIAAEIDRLKRIESSREEETQDAEPSFTITITASRLMALGLWIDACDLLGINEWAIKEGLMEYNHEITMSDAQAKQLGIL